MDLNQLHYFRVVAEHEHITRAAEHLHISQPSLSATISRLEKELGVTLFTRTSNTIQLNENGKIFLRHVNRMYTELDQGLLELRKKQEDGTGRISFCTFGPGITDDLIPRYVLSHPSVSITHTTASLEDMAARLNNDTIDFAISTQPLKSGEYNWAPLYTDHMIILLSAAHPLSGEPTIHMKDLAHERFAVFNADMNHLDLTLRLCGQAGFSPDIIYNGNEISLILTLVASNVCIFLCQAANGIFGKDDPRTSNTKATIWPSICDPNEPIPVGILTRKNKELSPAAREFIVLIKREYSNLQN